MVILTSGILKLQFFAMDNHVAAMIELAYDYGPSEEENTKRKTCLCGSTSAGCLVEIEFSVLTK